MRGWPHRLNSESLGFAVRLAVAVIVAMAAPAIAGSFVLLDQLRDSHVATKSSIQRSDVRALESISYRVHGRPPNKQRVDDALRVIGERSGVVEATLVDRRHTVIASGRVGSEHVVGTTDNDPRVVVALRTGASYAGHDTGTSVDRSNFEFDSPVALGDGRYALVVVYDHEFFDATIATVRTTMLLIGLLLLFGGGLVFYLVGGRGLMRSHRLALKRATRDGLTDLPNQRAFQDEFEQAVALAARHSEPLALVVLDIDDFKRINDHHGHPHGDAVLRRVADVLSAGRLGDRAYRLGGDEFALLLPRADEAGARRLGVRLNRSLTAAETGVSIGVSNLRRGQSGEDLRAEADAALYEAKHRGGNGVAYFDEIRSKVTLTSSAKIEPLRQLIAEAGITSAYQPIWDIEAGVLLGIEALMRPDPKYGLSGPEEAFDIAEQIGGVHQLDELCVQSALRIAPELPELTLLFVNVSPQTLDLDADGNDWLLAATREAGLRPEQVVVEVTERFVGRTASVTKCLQQLREQGFKLAIDDVGTGNSGLEMLRQIEAEFVKIDRSIITAAVTEPAARAVLLAMATFASQTDSLVIAEGIEDQETLDFLREIDDHAPRPGRIITGGQGYGLGRPAPVPALGLPALLEPCVVPLHPPIL